MAKKGKLTPKQELFVKEYLIDLNASAAARRAGYSLRTADRTGHENLKKPEIQAEIQAERDKRTNNLDITIDRVLRERAKLAFYNTLELFLPNGQMKPIDQIPPELAAAICGLDVMSSVQTDADGNPVPAQILKFRLPDKNKALDALDKYLGLYKEDNAQKGQVDQETRQQFMADLFKTISQANGRGLPEPRE